MTLHEIRQLVLDSRSDTLMAQRFREAFGIRSKQERKTRTITDADYRRRRERREVMQAMSQRYGALDRGSGS